MSNDKKKVQPPFPDDLTKALEAIDALLTAGAIAGGVQGPDDCDCPICVARRSSAASVDTKQVEQVEMSPAVQVSKVSVHGAGSAIEAYFNRADSDVEADPVYTIRLKGRNGKNILAVANPDGSVSLILRGSDALIQVASFIDQVSEL